jgi:hypothetical protein
MGVNAVRSEARFEALALEIFHHQYERNAPYRRLCETFGVQAERVGRWQDIPAVPTGAYKEARLATFPEEEEIRTFRTSGSTTQRPGELHLDTLELYEASLRATFGAYVCAGVRRIRFAVLAPSAAEAPDSSLSHMFSVACREFGTPESRFYAMLEAGDVLADLKEIKEPVAVVGTSFAFVHLLDAFEARDLALELPGGSRVMETGGFKGRSREVTREKLHASISAALGVVCSAVGAHPRGRPQKHGRRRAG